MQIRVSKGETKVLLTTVERNRMVETRALCLILAKHNIDGAADAATELAKVLILAQGGMTKED